MQLLNNVSLKQYNTFGMDVKASFFATADHPGHLISLLSSNDFSGSPLLILGGGSNILFTKDYEGLVLKVNFKGVKHQASTSDHVLVSAGAGEKWDELVQYCVNQEWGGLENLSLIPGSVGAAPIQNIGAYGVELKDVFSHLDAIDLQTFEPRRFTISECGFGYRSSIFKQVLKGRYLITSVSFNLSSNPQLDLSYPALQHEIGKSGLQPSVKTVAESVIRIRRSKLPDPEEMGNAGSFFKNPVVRPDVFEGLKSGYPSMPFYDLDDGSYKIPAAWLIEQCGWKGRRFGDAGVHARQPLVLVNYGTATGLQIFELAEQIRESVLKRFGITLEAEVNIL
jgi:UDP-N-acetylmuramate dehydrogenase